MPGGKGYVCVLAIIYGQITQNALNARCERFLTSSKKHIYCYLSVNLVCFFILTRVRLFNSTNESNSHDSEEECWNAGSSWKLESSRNGSLEFTMQQLSLEGKGYIH